MQNIALFFKLMWNNTKGLPLGIKLFCVASILVVLLKCYGLSSDVSWSIALFVVIGFVCTKKIIYAKKVIGDV